MYEFTGELLLGRNAFHKLDVQSTALMTKNIIQSVGELELVHVKEIIVVFGGSLIRKVDAVPFVDTNLSLRIMKEGQFFWRTNIALLDLGKAQGGKHRRHLSLAQVIPFYCFLHARLTWGD